MRLVSSVLILVALLMCPRIVFSQDTIHQDTTSKKTKLVEESQELLLADDKKSILNEICDVYEILEYIKKTNSLSDIEVEQKRLQKKP